MCTPSTTVETVAAISKNEIYLNYVKQAAVGCIMGALQHVAKSQKLTPNESLTIFFHPTNKDQSMNLVFALFKKYIQTCCDEFCWIYDNVYIETRISLKEALNLDGSYYAFSHFNKIFENSRSNFTAGPKHLNCLVTCTVDNYMPLLLSTILAQHGNYQIGGTRTSRDGNWSEAEKNVVRVVLQELVQKAVDWLNTHRQEELKTMPFICEGEQCNRNWDLFNFPKDKQTIAIQNSNKFWGELSKIH